jgi:hypothetical protein
MAYATCDTGQRDPGVLEENPGDLPVGGVCALHDARAGPAFGGHRQVRPCTRPQRQHEKAQEVHHQPSAHAGSVQGEAYYYADQAGGDPLRYSLDSDAVSVEESHCCLLRVCIRTWSFFFAAARQHQVMSDSVCLHGNINTHIVARTLACYPQYSPRV